MPPFTLRLGKCYPFFIRWCRRYDAHFPAVGAAFHTTARVNSARFSAVGVGVVLPTILLLVPPFTQRLGVNAVRFGAGGVGVMLPILLLLVPSFTLQLG